MKLILSKQMKWMSLGAFLVLTVSWAQDQPINPNNTIALQNISAIGAGAQNLGGTTMVTNRIGNVEGSVHLFESWSNTGILDLGGDDSKRYLIRNINYNIYRDAMESQVGKDSVFTFDNPNIERFYINSREFKKYYFPRDAASRYFEVIYENSDFSLVRLYTLGLSEGSNNPMVNRPSKYVTNSEVYVRKGNSFKSARLRKSTILELAGSKSKELDTFVKENDLSYKKDFDVRQMLEAVLGKQ